MKTKLPTIKDGFLWGGSLSAVQVDGIGSPARSEIWQDYLYRKYPERHWSGIGPYLAIDFTRRYKEDIETYKFMGINSVRYGFQWARLFPDGINLSLEAVKYYHDVIDAFNKAGVKVMMQLVHFDSPTWVKALGGWQNEEVQKRFGVFAEFVFREYAAKVEHFCTFNEPAVMKGMFGDKDWWNDEKPTTERIYRECFGLFKANARAFYVFQDLKAKKVISKKVKLGVVVNYNKTYPANPENPSKADLEAVKYCDAFQNIFWTDGMVDGKLNELVRRAFKEQKVELPFSKAEEEYIKNVKLDFIGENYYLPWRVVARPESEKLASTDNPEFNYYKSAKYEKARMNHFRGWEIFPLGLTEGLKDMWARHQVPLYIGENGMGVDNEGRFRGKNGIILDEYRISFIKEHLIALQDAMDQGVKIFGYHVWSITDLWSSYNGMKNRYGFVEVNLNKNLERKPKLSAYWYKDFINSGIIDHNFERCEVITKKAMEESLAVMAKRSTIGKQNYELIKGDSHE